MSLDVILAAEYPDIYQQFLKPEPSYEDMVHDANKNMTVVKGARTRTEHSTRNVSLPGSTKSVNAVMGCVPATGFQSVPANYISHSKFDGAAANSSEFADIDNILSILEDIDENPRESTNSLLGITKTAFGCKWTDSTPSCSHGHSCPFIQQFLGLSDVQSPVVVDQAPLVHNVVVLRQTPAGMVKLQESLVPIGQRDAEKLQAMSPEAQVRHLGLDNAQLRQRDREALSLVGGTSSSPTTLKPRHPVPEYSQPSSTQYMSQYSVPFSTSTGRQGQYYNTQATVSNSMNVKFRPTDPVPYRPPPNAVLVKVPSSVQSYQNQYPSATSPPNAKSTLICSHCDWKFLDSKALVKHTRNQHQVYQCQKCGEETEGYYRMASHTKRNHSKEPTFFCQCGRTFAEKRGLTKHQNTCSYQNPVH